MIKSYLINLDQDQERLQFFSENFARLGLEFERISAIDGRLYSEEDFLNFTRERPRTNKSWMRGQMGCFLSHFNTWKKIAEGEDRYYCVFEDDIHISDDLKVILSSDSWIPDDIDIIRLETSTNRVRLSSSPVLNCNDRHAYNVKSTSWCAGAYIINRKTAQRLVALPVKFHEPADVILYNFSDSAIAAELRILQFHPAPCTQDKHLANGAVNFSSNIEAVPSNTSRIKMYLQRLAPTALIRGVFRSLIGYKRILFQ